MLLNCGVGENSWEFLGLQGDPTSPSERRSVLGVHWKDWCWSWNSNTLATWWEELTNLKRPWCWERLKVGGEGDDRGWDGWMASLTRWTWVWVDSRSWWWTGRPGVLRFMGLQRVIHDWATELNRGPRKPSLAWLHNDSKKSTKGIRLNERIANTFFKHHSKTSLNGMVGEIILLFQIFSLCICVLQFSKSYSSLSCLFLWLSFSETVSNSICTEVNDRTDQSYLYSGIDLAIKSIFQRFYVVLAN